MASILSQSPFGGTRLQHWTAMLWNVMTATGKGYRRHKLGHTGLDDDRRKDKLRETTEGYTDEDGTEKIRTVFVPFSYDESKIQRAARLKKLGVRHGR
jgi:hypothetical protein